MKRTMKETERGEEARETRKRGIPGGKVEAQTRSRREKGNHGKGLHINGHKNDKSTEKRKQEARRVPRAPRGRCPRSTCRQKNMSKGDHPSLKRGWKTMKRPI